MAANLWRGDLPDHLEDLAAKILDGAFRVHRELGPGLLESAYAEALAYELTKDGLEFEREKQVALIYDGIPLASVAYRADFVVEEAVILELKALSKIASVHEAQLLTYLRLADKRMGFVLNFGQEKLRKGIHRFVR